MPIVTVAMFSDRIQTEKDRLAEQDNIIVRTVTREISTDIKCRETYI
jgi:hypothetical protein